MRAARIAAAIACLASFTRSAHAQLLQCTLHRPSVDSAYAGSCIRNDTAWIQLSLQPPRDSSHAWRGHGMIRGEPWAYPMFLELRPDGGTFGHFRGWNEIGAATADSQTLRFEYVRGTGSPLRDRDLEILRRARALLATAADWNQHDSRDSSRPDNCLPPTTPRTLFCALHDASTEVLGDYYGGPGIGQAFEAVFRVRQNDRHPLQALNNDPQTTIATIHAVLDDAISRVAAALAAQRQR